MKNQKGFAAIAAIVVLVLLAALAGAITSISASQQAESAQDVLSARAWAAAKAGNEWGLYQALNSTANGIWYWNPVTFLPATPPCDAASAVVKTQTLDLSASTGMWVTVSCSSITVNEGLNSSGAANKSTIYTINAVACNSSAGCPDNISATSPGYIERRRQVTATALAASS